MYNTSLSSVTRYCGYLFKHLKITFFENMTKWEVAYQTNRNKNILLMGKMRVFFTRRRQCKDGEKVSDLF